MADSHEGGTNNDSNTTGPARRRKQGATAIRLRPPLVVPMSDEDYRQAVSALAAMIASWWRDQHEHRSE